MSQKNQYVSSGSVDNHATDSPQPDKIGVDLVKRHRERIIVATCCNCVCFSRACYVMKGHGYEGCKKKVQKVIPGNPKDCPDCTYALFYETINKTDRKQQTKKKETYNERTNNLLRNLRRDAAKL